MTYHWDDKEHKSYGKHWIEGSFSYSKEFHIYGLLWEPDKIVWYIDGVERSRFTNVRVIVSKPMSLLINFGIDARWPGSCDSTAPFPSYYQCDEIKAYEGN